MFKYYSPNCGKPKFSTINIDQSAKIFGVKSFVIAGNLRIKKFSQEVNKKHYEFLITGSTVNYKKGDTNDVREKN